MTGRLWPVDAVTGAPSYSGRLLRQTTVSSLAGMGNTGRPLGGLSGVRPNTPTTIATATSTLWTVTPFDGLIDAAVSSIAGTYAYAFDSNQTGAVTAAGASARTDRLDVQVIDPAEGGVSGANPLIQIVYTVGTPTLAAAPAQSHPLAQINVPTSGSPTVTWVASYYAAAGGAVPFNTLSGLNAWTTTGAGQMADVRADTTASNNGLYRFDGTTWQRPGTYGLYQRPTTNTYISGSFISMGILSIATAPPGIYKVDVNLLTKNSAAFTGTMRVLGNAANLNGDTPCDHPANSVVAAGGSWSGFLVHNGGTLTVEIQHNASGGSPAVQTGTSIAAHRISGA